ncbi:MAG: glycosyltransferase family 1 protein [Pseudomonadota bacterium]
MKNQSVITLVSETFLPDVNGVARTLDRLSKELCIQGVKIQLIVPKNNERILNFSENNSIFSTLSLPLPGYPMVRLGGIMPNQLKKIWQQERPDFVYIATQGPLGLIAMLTAKKLKIPVISGFHTQFHNYAQDYGLGWATPVVLSYLRWFHNSCNATLTPTREMQQELVKKEFERVRVWGRGVDTQLFTPSKRSLSKRKKLGLAVEDFLLLYVGRIAKEKNLDVVFKSYYAARAVRKNTRLLVVGDGPLLENLKKLHPEVIFTGEKNGEAVAETYAMADVFLFPSLTDTFGNVVLEAMASAAPVVAFNQAAAKIHIQHNISGKLVSKKSEKKFVEMVLEMIKCKPEELKRMGEHARNEAKRFNWPLFAEQFLKYCRKVQLHSKSVKKLTKQSFVVVV